MRSFFTLFIASSLLILLASAAPTQPVLEDNKPIDVDDDKKAEQENGLATLKPIEDKKPEEESALTTPSSIGDNVFTDIAETTYLPAASTNAPGKVTTRPKKPKKGKKKGKKNGKRKSKRGSKTRKNKNRRDPKKGAADKDRQPKQINNVY